MKRYDTQVPSKRAISFDDGMHDLHPTPPGFTNALLRHVLMQGKVWECACGDGSMSKAIAKFGYQVVSTNDIPQGHGRAGVDFLATKSLRAPNIVTNPPFADHLRFIEHGLALQPDTLAFLLKADTMCGVDRFERVYRDHPPSLIIAIIERMRNSYSGSSYSFYHAWYVWQSRRLAVGTQVIWESSRA